MNIFTLNIIWDEKSYICFVEIEVKLMELKIESVEGKLDVFGGYGVKRKHFLLF